MPNTGDDTISEDLRHLASGPRAYVNKYTGFVVNGYRFRTKDMESKRKTQNCGVMINAMTEFFSSAKDNNPIAGEVTYYGILNYILEITYAVGKRVVLFHCDWVSDGGSRITIDEFGFTSVKFAGMNYNFGK